MVKFQVLKIWKFQIVYSYYHSDHFQILKKQEKLIEKHDFCRWKIQKFYEYGHVKNVSLLSALLSC